MNRTGSDDAFRAGGQPIAATRVYFVFANKFTWFLFKLNLAPYYPIL